MREKERETDREKRERRERDKKERGERQLPSKGNLSVWLHFITRSNQIQIL